MTENNIKVGDIYICKVTRILQHGANILIGDTGKEGFIHISEISKRWVSNVKDILKEGSQIVCKVIDVSPQMVELSAKRVTDNEKKQALKEWSIENRIRKLIEVTDKNANSIIEDIKKKFGSLYNFYDELASGNTSAIDKVDVKDETKEALLSFVEKSRKKLTIKTELTIRSLDPNGIEKIRNFLSEKFSDKKYYDISYIKAPEYLLTVSAETPKKTLAENKKILSEMEKKSKEFNLEFSYKEIKK